MQIVIKNGRLINPKTNFDGTANIYIEGKKIIAIGEMPPGFVADREIDASDKYVFPGLVDLSVRLREPGFEYKATITSETRAAASAGITTVCCPPDTIPVIDNPTVVEMIHHRANQANKARVVTIGALTQGLEGKKISEMLALKNAGAVGVGNAFKSVKSTSVMRRAMEYASSHNLTVFLHAEDPWLKEGACAHEGPMSTRMGLPGIPEIAETIAVYRELALIEKTGVRAHFCRLSSAKAERLVARAKYDGLPVTSDVAAHQLHLSDMDVGDFNAHCHVRPPLRSISDRDGLRRGLQEKSINAICSDHQPHDLDAKIGPFSSTEPGISSLETLLPLTIRLVRDGDLSLMDALSYLTCEPAKILNLDVGTIEVGANADICIYDPDEIWSLSAEKMVSAGHNTPFLGWEFEGKVACTLFNGQVVYTSNEN